jgi:mono/diheme cytochrome c family protein
VESQFNRSIPIATTLLVLLLILGMEAARRGREPAPPMDDVAMGRDLYRAVCQQCHNPDPRLDSTTGSPQGPAIAGSSLELLKARVLRAEYPPGYQPKRATKLMPAQTNVDERGIELIHAFLGSFK